METQFAPLGQTEYPVLGFDGRPRFSWKNSTSSLNVNDIFLLQRLEPSIFVLDFNEALASDQGVQAFLRQLALVAIEQSHHLFFVLANPRLLASAFVAFFESADFTRIVDRVVDRELTPFLAPAYRTMLRHIFVGSRFNNSFDDPEHDLPWLMTVSYFRTFIWVDGKINEHHDLEDLKPWSGDAPYPGDFNLFDGQVYEAGSYRYRDSDAAHLRTLRKLSLAIFEVGDQLTDEEARHILSQADDADRFQVPHMLIPRQRHSGLGARFEEFRFSGDEMIEELMKRVPA